jgi:hypothetical protein
MWSSSAMAAAIAATLQNRAIWMWRIFDQS